MHKKERVVKYLNELLPYLRAHFSELSILALAGSPSFALQLNSLLTILKVESSIQAVVFESPRASKTQEMLNLFIRNGLDDLIGSNIHFCVRVYPMSKDIDLHLDINGDIFEGIAAIKKVVTMEDVDHDRLQNAFAMGVVPMSAVREDILLCSRLLHKADSMFYAWNEGDLRRVGDIPIPRKKKKILIK